MSYEKLLLITFALIGVLNAQNGNHIHHLFGLKQGPSGLYTQSALSQQNGNEVEIETFSMTMDLGGPYTYFTNTNSVFYIDSNGITIGIVNQYNLPQIYESGYAGSGSVFTLQGSIAEVCANPLSDSLIYGFDFFQKVVTSYFYNQGFSNGNSGAMSNINDEASLNMVYYDDKIYVSAKTGIDSVSIYVVDVQSLNVIDTFDYTAESIFLVAEPTMGIYGVVRDAFDQYSLVLVEAISGQLFNIGGLPSCSTCVVEEFLYDKNALVLDPENSEIILSRSETIAGNTNYFLSTYELQNGAEIYNVVTPDRWSNLIFQKPQADLVYPGDANHDKVVDMLDLLPIGLKYNDTLSERIEISNEWVGQFAINTNDTLANGVDKKHADCNGDGQVNAVDINALNQNYDYIHYSEKSTNALCDFPLYINFPSLVKEDEDVEISIGLDMSEDLAQNVYGIVFTVEFDSSFIVQNSLNTTGFNGGWFGQENGNYIQRNQVDFPEGRMDVGVVGIDKMNRTGGGVLLDGIWTMEDVVIPIAQGYLDMPVRITNVTIIDFDENEIDACGVDTVIRVYDKNVGVKNRTTAVLDIHPNPTKSNVLNLAHMEALDLVEIYDIQGRLLNTWSQNFASLNIGTYNKGVYIVKAYAGETVYINKLVYDKE